MENFQENISEYRKSLQALQESMQSEYDKTVLTLSAGGLGISLTFLKDIASKQGPHDTYAFLAAWICWGTSVSCVLASYFTSAQALQKAIKQTDDRGIYIEPRGGLCNLVTQILNGSSGFFFLGGVAAIAKFIFSNT